MAIVATQDTQTAESSTVTLSEYARAIRVCECGFWGVSNSGCDDSGCRSIFSLQEREYIAFYLAEAQEEIERELGYFIGKRWVTDERHDYSVPIIADWQYVISGGVRAESDIELDSVVDHTDDPAIVGPIVTTVTDETEIHVYHPDTDVEIDPSSITISGGSVTIEIPRCRMVKSNLADNPDDGLGYTQTSNFESTVDVKRVYNDTSTEAKVIRACGTGCSETESDACIYIAKHDIGELYIQACCTCPSFVDLNYYAGVTMTKQARDTIVRLAHVKMPRPPCTCASPAKEMWEYDRETPDVLTAERLNCPYGPQNGAWIAWRWTQAQSLVVGTVL